MAESSSSLSFFYCSSFTTAPTISRCKLPFCHPSSSSLSTPRVSSSSSSSSSSRLLARSIPKESGGGDFIDDNPFSFYPWDSFNPQGDGSAGAIEWIQEERVTLFTADGLVQIGGSLVPREIASSDKKQGRGKASQRLQRFHERDYMDPNQGLCLGALFDIAATNGLDMGRRLCIFGFCRSIEMLSDVVEDAVLEHGGESIFQDLGQTWKGTSDRWRQISCTLHGGLNPT